MYSVVVGLRIAGLELLGLSLELLLGKLRDAWPVVECDTGFHYWLITCCISSLSFVLSVLIE